LGFVLSAGQQSEKGQALLLLDQSGPRPATVIADKAYDTDAIRAGLAERHITAVIPCVRIGSRDIPHDRSLYRTRNVIERLIGRLKQARRLATRYDKTAVSFAGCIALVAIRLLINFVNRA
jgi:transposase